MEVLPDSKTAVANANEKGASTPDANSIDNVDASTVQVYIDPAMERRVIRKFDWYVMPQFVLLVILGYLDRTNIGNARVFGFDEDLGLVGNQFADMSSLFFVTYVLFEVPWVQAMKRFGTHNVMAIMVIAWSAITIGTGFVRNYHEVLATRILLGAAEAGLFSACNFSVSTIYPRSSQGKRVAVLYGATCVAGAFGGLISYGIQLMGDRHGLAAWRWLFIVEGIISIVIGLGCWFTLPKTAHEAWFLTQEERKMMSDRRIRDAAYAGDDKFSWSYLRMALTDKVIIVGGLSLFCAGVPAFGFGLFLPTIIKGMGFSSILVNCLTIPVYTMAVLALAVTSYISDRIGKRAIVAICVPVPVVIGYAIAIGTSNIGAGYFAMFLVSILYCYNTLLLTWICNNIKPEYKRAAAIPFFISIANISGVAASQVYPNRTAPRFIMGNAISLGLEAVAGFGIILVYLIFRHRNNVKAKQRAEGITDNGEKGDKSLDFTYMF